jgi:hypothetical protein
MQQEIMPKAFTSARRTYRSNPAPFSSVRNEVLFALLQTRVMENWVSFST